MWRIFVVLCLKVPMLSNMNLFFHYRLACMSNSVVYGIHVWRFENVAILNSLKIVIRPWFVREAMGGVLWTHTSDTYAQLTANYLELCWTYALHNWHFHHSFSLSLSHTHTISKARIFEINTAQKHKITQAMENNTIDLSVCWLCVLSVSLQSF